MFTKDILLIDAEFTGLDPKKHDLIQLAGVLLDKKTLKEKKYFTSYIKPTRWRNRDPKSIEISKLTWETLKDAPKLENVIKEFDRLFGHDVTLAYYVGILDIVYLLEAYKKAKLPWKFDYHSFNIWGLFYPYAALRTRLNNKDQFAGFSIEDLMAHFEITSAPLHDALVDCRVEAEVLRRIMQELKGKKKRT
jgi:CBS domain-containing protein